MLFAFCSLSANFMRFNGWHNSPPIWRGGNLLTGWLKAYSRPKDTYFISRRESSSVEMSYKSKISLSLSRQQSCLESEREAYGGLWFSTELLSHWDMVVCYARILCGTMFASKRYCIFHIIHILRSRHIIHIGVESGTLSATIVPYGNGEPEALRYEKKIPSAEGIVIR